MKFFIVVLYLVPAIAWCDPVEDSIARSREKLKNTPVVVSDESREWLRGQREQEERQRIEKLTSSAGDYDKVLEANRQRIAEASKQNPYDRVSFDSLPESKPNTLDYYLGKALATAFASAILMFGIRAFRAKPWTWQPKLIPRNVRITIAATLFWLLCVELWGFIWRWDNIFSTGEYVALHLSLPLLAFVVWGSHHWIKRA